MYVSRRHVITPRAFSIRKDNAKIMKNLKFTFLLMHFLYFFCINHCIRAFIMEILQKTFVPLSDDLWSDRYINMMIY